MQDLIGRTLGHYRIVEKIGAGGMGVVYRAHDERLDRDVAIKVLPEEVAADPERLARFEREAKLLASLNHPNIATLYGLEKEESRRFLVMELVEGESLAGVIARGPIPFDEALPIALQIAKALETAHEHGIVHRDLKPANVMVNSEEQVKVLDFGLAKAFDPDASGPSSPESIAESPTLTAEMTSVGTLLGTAAYMSPEKARGKLVDKKADIWAFGCVLFEMLTGTRAFAGTTSTEVLAAIIKDDPDWDGLTAETPTPIRRLLRRCLTKDPRDRLHDIADARIELQSLSIDGYNGDALATSAPIRAGWRTWLPWGLAAVLGALAVGILAWNLNRQVNPDVPKRFVIVPPINNPLWSAEGTDVAISPDGKTIVYVARHHGSSTQLCVRSMSQLEVRCLDGTDGGCAPFFSPNGKWLGYFSASEQKLKKLPMTSGPSVPVEICDAMGVFSASWGPNDTIVFGSVTRGYGISRVSVLGGNPEPVTVPSPEENEISHDSPVLLSDGKTLLFSIRREGGFDEAMVVAQDLATGNRVTLTKGGTNVRYSSTGHIIYNRKGTLLAAPFDRARLEVGNWTPVEDGIRVGGTHAAEFAISKEGTLVYVHGWTRSKTSLVWVNRRGEETHLSEQEDFYQQAQISPDGARIAFQIRTEQGPSSNVWIYDITRGVYNQWSFEGASTYPVWAPDSRRIAFVAEREGIDGIYITFEEEYGIGVPLWTSENDLQLSSWSPDGDWLAFIEYHPETKADIWLLSLQKGTATPLLNTSANENSPEFSPDGKWISHVSNESGRDEVYVQPFAGAGGKLRISTDGGTSATWALSGKELFYRRGDELFAVAVSTEPTFSKPGQPRALFEKKRMYSYDVHPDGTRFLVVKEGGEETDSLEIRVVLDWAEELKRLVPTG